MSSDTIIRAETPRKDKDPSFDFQRFLDQMKSKGAEPIAKYLRSWVFLRSAKWNLSDPYDRFLSNFAKRTFSVNDQIKIINDFLNVCVPPMPLCHAQSAALSSSLAPR